MAVTGVSTLFERLTDQERVVAAAVAEGRRNRDVAVDLNVSPRTIEAHLGRIYRKLGISSRSELVALSRSASGDTSRTDMPKTRYARAGKVAIAYQVAGEGPHDIVLVPGLASHIEMLWEQPQWRRFVRRMSKLGRFIVFDKRGTGLSDPMAPGVYPTLEDRMDDVTAVMDAAGSHKAILMGISEGGPMSLYFTASHPDRVAGLLLYGTTVPCTAEERLSDEMMELIHAVHGTGAIAAPLWPTMSRTEEGMRWLGRFERHCASPAMLRAIFDSAVVLDPTWVLPAIHVATTVVHGRQDPAIPFELAEEIMQYLPGGRLVPIDVVDHVPWGDVDLETILAELQELIDNADWDDEPTSMLVAVVAVGGTTPASRCDVEHWITTMGGQVCSADGAEILGTFPGPSTAVRCAAMLHGTGPRLNVGAAVGEARMRNGRLSGTVVEAAIRLAASADGDAVVSTGLADIAGGAAELAERPDGTYRVVSVRTG